MNKKTIQQENRFVSFVGFVLTSFFILCDHLSNYI
jgi:hypothetical protein